MMEKEILRIKFLNLIVRSFEINPISKPTGVETDWTWTSLDNGKRNFEDEIF